MAHHTLNIDGDSFEISRITSFPNYPNYDYCVVPIAENVTIVTIPVNLGINIAERLSSLVDTSIGKLIQENVYYVPVGSGDSNYIDSLMESL